MNKQAFEEFVRQNIQEPFQEIVLEMVLATAKPAIRLRTQPENDSAIAIGDSKIGGYPDLPSTYEWPRSPYTNEPLWFVAQLKIEDFKGWDVNDALPKKGLLYFFNMHDQGVVLYYTGDYQTLEHRTPPPELLPKRRNWLQRIFSRSERKVFESCKLIPSLEYTMHHWQALHQATIGVSPKEVCEYESFWDKYKAMLGNKYSDSRHLLLGTPIQSDYVEIGPKAIQNWQYPTKSDVEYLNQWTLLFQVDSDLNTKMSWGDWGRVYYLIEKEKLKNADFSNVYVESECY